MHLSIRPWTSADHSRLESLACPDGGQYTVSELTQMEAEQGPEAPFVALVAEVDGELAGRAFAARRPWTPRTEMNCGVVVAPPFRHRGVGTALFAALAPHFAAHRPSLLRANGPDDQPEAQVWAERHGFDRQQHILAWRLDLTGTAPAPPGSTAPAGFRFIPFATIQSPETEAELHQFYFLLHADTPDWNPAEYQAFPEWRKWALQSPEAGAESVTLAIGPDGQWAGFTLMHRWAPDSPKAHIFMTGVRREYRNQGIATAMKAAAAGFAQATGITAITTITDWENEPMNGVNRRLGYQVEMGFYRLIKPLPQPT